MLLQDEKKAKARQRGDPKRQTSDARFDASFAFAHGMTGRAPWYARSALATAATTAAPTTGATAPVDTIAAHADGQNAATPEHAHLHRQHAVSGAVAEAATVVGNVATRGHKRRRKPGKHAKSHKHKDKHNKEHRRKHKRKRSVSSSDSESDNHSSLNSGSPPAKTAAKADARAAFDALRAERLEREKAESGRSKQLMQQHYGR